MDELEALRAIGADTPGPTEKQKNSARALLEAAYVSGVAAFDSARPRARKRRTLVTVLLAATLVGGTAAAASSFLSRDDFNTTAGLTGTSLGEALDLPRASWDPGSSTPDQPLQFTSAPGKVAGCGGDDREDTVRVATPTGVVYCIEGVNASDPESVFMARSIAERLIYNHVPSDLELRILWLDSQLNFGTPSEEQRREWTQEIDRLWAAASPEERKWLEK